MRRLAPRPLGQPATAGRIAAPGGANRVAGPESLRAWLDKMIEVWSRMARTNNIRPDRMPETPEGLLARLAAAGIAAETRHHPPVFTVAESRGLRGELPGGHTKNLFLKPAKGDGPFLLATLEEERQVSVNALARLAGAGKVRMASAEELVATLGVPPGSVTPLGLVNARPDQVRFVMDRHLVDGFDRIWVHPLTNAASTGLAPADLLRFLAGLGHEALLLDLDAPA